MTESAEETVDETTLTGVTAMDWAEQLLAARRAAFGDKRFLTAARGDSTEGFSQARRFLREVEMEAATQPNAMFTYHEKQMTLQDAANHLRLAIQQVELVRA